MSTKHFINLFYCVSTLHNHIIDKRVKVITICFYFRTCQAFTLHIVIGRKPNFIIKACFYVLFKFKQFNHGNGTIYAICANVQTVKKFAFCNNSHFPVMNLFQEFFGTCNRVIIICGNKILHALIHRCKNHSNIIFN